MANLALRRGHQQPRLLGFMLVLAAASLVVLLIAGASDGLALTVLPAVAGLTGFAMEEYNLHRVGHGHSAVARHLRAGVTGTAVFIATVLMYSAT
jgi:hypothetical protein